MIKMTNHQTIAITVSGLAELAHSEYQVNYFISKIMRSRFSNLIFTSFRCFVPFQCLEVCTSLDPLLLKVLSDKCLFSFKGLPFFEFCPCW
jgi:hypothetical protein